MRKSTRFAWIAWIAVGLLIAFGGEPSARGGAARKKAAAQDPFAELVWPPPPDDPKIKLTAVIEGRGSVEKRSGFRRRLLGDAANGPYDRLRKPFAVAFDTTGRILVTDPAAGALFRFDRTGRRMDVLGTRGRIHLESPLGLDVAPDGTIYVADIGLRKVLALDGDGSVLRAYGRQGELTNPTDAALSPDGKRLYVADSKGQRIVVFDAASAERLSAFGERGEGEAQFNFPTSLTFGPSGDLFVVDQLNARVQIFAPDGEYLDSFGQLGVGYADFVRPKDVAVGGDGRIYVTDNAFNNVQVLDLDFTLLTFVGEGGTDPGTFHGASGVAIRGREFAVVDQLGRRVQIFELLDGPAPKEHQ